MIAIISTGEAIAIGGNPDATNTNSLTFWHMFSYEFLAGQLDDTYPQPNHSITMYQNNHRMIISSSNGNNINRVGLGSDASADAESGRRLVEL